MEKAEEEFVTNRVGQRAASADLGLTQVWVVGSHHQWRGGMGHPEGLGECQELGLSGALAVQQGQVLVLHLGCGNPRHEHRLG